MKRLFIIVCIIASPLSSAIVSRTAQILKYGGAALSPVIIGTSWQMLKQEEIFDGWCKGLVWGLHPVRNLQMASLLLTDEDDSICVCTTRIHKESNDRLFRNGFAAGLLTSCVTIPIATVCALRSPRAARMLYKKM